MSIIKGSVETLFLNLFRKSDDSKRLKVEKLSAVLCVDERRQREKHQNKPGATITCHLDHVFTLRLSMHESKSFCQNINPFYPNDTLQWWAEFSTGGERWVNWHSSELMSTHYQNMYPLGCPEQKLQILISLDNGGPQLAGPGGQDHNFWSRHFSCLIQWNTNKGQR